MLTQGKQKIDESYNWLKATMIQSKLLRNNLDEKKRKIQELEDEAIRLNQHIQLAQNEQVKQDGLVEEARSESKQKESMVSQEEELKNEEIKVKEYKWDLQQIALNRDYEICQMSLEDERSQCLMLKTQMDKEERITQLQYMNKNES